jgi:hypothetical protein
LRLDVGDGCGDGDTETVKHSHGVVGGCDHCCHLSVDCVLFTMVYNIGTALLSQAQASLFTD